jgi:hypothetical protein
MPWSVSGPAGPGAGAAGVRRIYCGAMTGLRFGQPAPDFSLPATTGEIRLADFHGLDVVLIFYCYDWGSI